MSIKKAFLFLFTACLLFTSLPAQKAPWSSLFDGKTLKGWNQKNGATKYSVENGQIVGTTVANNPNAFLCTNQEFDNFILERDLKVDEARREWRYIPNINPTAKKAFRIGEWNKYRIEAIGNTLRTWINGVPVAHLIDDLTACGFIALQVHGIYGNELL